jgi:2,3-bisphosphoglycerate-dependent phosphoglycerate mutase
MAYLILLRHGQSAWNKKNVFTGWVDIPLSLEGVEESIAAGTAIQNYPIDVIFCSQLMRAKMTATLAMLPHKSQKVPVILTPSDDRMQGWSHIYDLKTKDETLPLICAWQLNERMYGQLQGLNKAATAEKFGKEQVQKWRRSYNEKPPEGESLHMTVDRVWPYFQKVILPYLKEGKHVLITAHGNSLRAIMMHLDRLSENEVSQLELATGKPYIYEYKMTLNKYEKIS